MVEEVKESGPARTKNSAELDDRFNEAIARERIKEGQMTSILYLKGCSPTQTGDAGKAERSSKSSRKKLNRRWGWGVAKWPRKS